MTPYTLHHGHCVDVLRTLPADSVQCVVTSPPYRGLRRYLPAGHPLEHLQIGLEPSIGAHLAAQVEVFREVRRVLRADGTLWLNIGDRYSSGGRDGGSMPESTNVASIRAASGGSSRTYVGVRRLTVAECEILQGFPVGYTAIPTGKARKISDDVAAYLQRHGLPCYRRHDRWYTKISADVPRYKALGNAMAVPVMRWIGERIYKKREDHPKIA